MFFPKPANSDFNKVGSFFLNVRFFQYASAYFDVAKKVGDLRQ